MTNKISFNFHDLVGLEIISDSPKIWDFYRSEYDVYLVDDLDKQIPTISLWLELSPPPISRKDLISTSHKTLANWHYKISFSDSNLSIEAYSNYFGMFMVHHMIVHPSIRYLAAKKRVLLLHAGAVTKNGRSIILTGSGGVGKTTTTSQLLIDDDEILPHADDYIFLDDSDCSLSYITRSHLYGDLLKSIPILSTRLKLLEKVSIYTFSALRRFSKDKIKWPTRVSQDRLWPERGYASKAQVGAIVFLSRQPIDQPRLEINQDINQLADKLIEMNFAEAAHFINLVNKQAKNIQYQQWLSDWREREYQLIINRLKNIPHFYLLIPDSIADPVETRKKVNDLLTPLFV
jgi:hypothetical protein